MDSCPADGLENIVFNMANILSRLRFFQQNRQRSGAYVYTYGVLVYRLVDHKNMVMYLKQRKYVYGINISCAENTINAIYTLC